MRFLSGIESQHWVHSIAMPGPADDLRGSGLLHQASYRLPGDAGRKTALASRLAGLAASERHHSLLWITGYGVWPSSEHRPLFDRFRQGLGESRDLAAAPGQLAGPADREDLTSLLALSLYFCWDASLYIAAGRALIALTHDEMLDVAARDVATLVEIEEELRSLGLSPA